jgi:hypothetical protein
LVSPPESPERCSRGHFSTTVPSEHSLSLIRSEKAGINIQETPATSKPLEEFIRQFTSGNGDAPKKSTATAEKPTTASR